MEHVIRDDAHCLNRSGQPMVDGDDHQLTQRRECRMAACLFFINLPPAGDMDDKE